jgi:hypothetical protein
MAWAEATACSKAVQNPRVAFRDEQLQAGELATNRMGLPLVHTGNFAAVFQMRRPAGPPDWALKCFTRQVHGLWRRYHAIHTHLNGRRLTFIGRAKGATHLSLSVNGMFLALEGGWNEFHPT